MTPDNEIAVRPSQAPEPYDEREAKLRELIKAQIMPHRTDVQGRDLGPATDAETDLMLAEAASMGLSILAGQAKPIRFEKGGPCVLQPTWTGLVKQAQDTGEYGGIEAILYTDGTKATTVDQWGNARLAYVWQDAWESDEPPVACKVGVWRKGQPRPSWGIAHYSTWGTDPDPDGWSTKKGPDGKPVRRKTRAGEWYDVRIHNGARVPKASPWWKMPGAIHQLAIAALRLALKADFQPDLFRRATMTAANRAGLDRDERLALAEEITGHPVASFNELEPGEYTEVYDAIVARGLDVPDYEEAEITQTAPNSSLDEGAQASPPPRFGASINPAWGKRPADSSAGQPERTTGAPVRQADPGSTPGSAPAEPLSAGRETDSFPASPGESTAPVGPPAEHTPDEGDEEAPDSAAGEAREARGREAAVPPEPTPAPKPRRKPPAPSVAQVREAQQAKTETKRQYEIDRPPSAWLLTLPPKAVRFLMHHFETVSKQMDPGKSAEQFVAGWVADHPDVVPPLDTWQRDDDWPNETINVLVADLPPKGDAG